jgi:hypothetical protein
VGSPGPTGVRRRSPESSKRRTHVGIAWLASRLRRVRSSGIRQMMKTRKLLKLPLRVLYPWLLGKGILDFRLPPYNPRGERMAAKPWNPCSFTFLFSLAIFLGLA